MELMKEPRCGWRQILLPSDRDNRSRQYRWLIPDIDSDLFEPRQIRSRHLAERIGFALLP